MWLVGTTFRLSTPVNMYLLYVKNNSYTMYTWLIACILDRSYYTESFQYNSANIWKLAAETQGIVAEAHRTLLT
jgi:hypothetical protein